MQRVVQITNPQWRWQPPLIVNSPSDDFIRISSELMECFFSGGNSAEPSNDSFFDAAERVVVKMERTSPCPTDVETFHDIEMRPVKEEYDDQPSSGGEATPGNDRVCNHANCAHCGHPFFLVKTPSLQAFTSHFYPYFAIIWEVVSAS